MRYTDHEDSISSLPDPWFQTADGRCTLLHGDSLAILPLIEPGSVNLIFADPPYFLSNGGITCHAGRRVSVDKGEWDASQGPEQNHAFNLAWLGECQRVLSPNGSLWVSGTAHVIFSVGYAMQQLGMKLLNDIVWVKPNPPPNLSCRYFTHASETLLWAAKNARSRHVFNYEQMKQLAGGKQMKSVWEIAAPSPAEKSFGKHPTQKPIELLKRIILASSHKGDLVLDPFCGSGTTGVAALALGRRFIGIEREEEFLTLAKRRIEEQLRQGCLAL